MPASCRVQQRHCSLCEGWDRVRLASPSPSQWYNTTVTFVWAFYSKGHPCQSELLLACRYYDSLGFTIFPQFTDLNGQWCWWHFLNDKAPEVGNASSVNHSPNTNTRDSFISCSASWNLLSYLSMCEFCDDPGINKWSGKQHTPPGIWIFQLNLLPRKPCKTQTYCYNTPSALYLLLTKGHQHSCKGQ